MTEEEAQQPDDGSWLDVKAGGDGSEFQVTGGDLAKPEPVSDYAVRQDDWSKRRGRDLAKEDVFKQLGADELTTADAHAMLFDHEPELVEQCSSPERLQYFQQLQNSEDYQALHVNTVHDTLASELGAMHLTKEWVALCKRRQEEQEKKEKQNKGKPQKPDPNADLRKEMQSLAAAKTATQNAQKEVDDLNDMREAMGCGRGEGGDGTMSKEQVKQLFQRVKNNQNIKRICELAGQYRLVARAKQRNKVVHGQDDMVGVVLSNDLGRVLPHELAALGDEDLELDALRRFAEKALMSREWRGVESVAKGPIIVAIDESGSMGGDKICHAKAFGLTMAWIARQQNRWCGLVGWSDGPKVRGLALPPRTWPTAQVMQWLGQFLGGGTYIPAKYLPKLYEQLGAIKGKTDIIFITDGDVPALPTDEMNAFKKWKQEVNAKVITISIQSKAQAFLPISEEYYEITNLSPNNAAVGEALSI